MPPRRPSTETQLNPISPHLVEPSLALLPGYEAALAQGWSPDTTQDISAAQLAALRADPDAFLRDLTRQDGTITLSDGRVVPRLPSRNFWISDGAFAGRIGLRYVPGTEALPPHVLGHVGYTIIPAKRRRGYASAALRQILPIAASLGLRHLTLTCADDNLPSRRVIEGAGGVLTESIPHPLHANREQLVFRVPTTP